MIPDDLRGQSPRSSLESEIGGIQIGELEPILRTGGAALALTCR